MKYRVVFRYSVLYGDKQYKAGEEAEISEKDYENLKYIVSVIEKQDVKIENQEQKMKEKQKQK